MLSLQFQFQNPITCLHKLSYCPFHAADIRTDSSTLCFGFMSQPMFPKHRALSIGSTGFQSKDMVPSTLDFGLCEEGEEGGGEEEDDDDCVEGRDKVDAFILSKKENSPWGEVKDDNGDDDDDEYVEGREKVDAFFLSKKVSSPWGEVKDDNGHDDNNGHDDEYVEGRENVDSSFVSRKELPPWGEMGEEDDDDDECVEGEEKVDSRPVDTTLPSSKEMKLMNKHGALFLEEMDENVLSNRILVLSRTNKIRSAMEYFRSMELSGLTPNIHACNSLISSLLRNGWLDDCFKVFNFMRTRKISSGHTYSLILTAHLKARGYDSTLKFFRELESKCDVKKDFDAIVYNTMISICRKVGNWSEIERLWRSMKANGCAGTHVTYRLLVHSYAHCGQSELALYAYHEMVQNGYEADGNMLNAMISVYAKEGKWDVASSVFQKMMKDGLKPNLVSCNALIHSLGRAGEIKLAFQVYDMMKSLGHKPDVYTFSALLGSLNKADRHHDALQLFDMIEENETCQFNVHLYNTVLMSCSKLRKWDRSLQILWQMEASGLSDLTVSYNLVIRACEVARKPTIALQVYEHMVHRKCVPNTLTCLSVIRCCVYGNLWEQLEEILNKIMPNGTLYNAAVQGMCIRGKVNLANKVYAKMLESGLQPDVKTRVLMQSMRRK